MTVVKHLTDLNDEEMSLLESMRTRARGNSAWFEEFRRRSFELECIGDTASARAEDELSEDLREYMTSRKRS